MCCSLYCVVSCAGLVCILANCAQFAYVTVFPLFVNQTLHPFGSTLVQLFASGFLVFIGSPYGNTYFLPTAKRANPRLPLLQPLRHLLLLSITRTLRFEDVFTDASISHLFFSISRSGSCPWMGGRSRCDRYTSMAVANIICAGLDFLIALIFVIAGFVLENVSKRGHRCAQFNLLLLGMVVSVKLPVHAMQSTALVACTRLHFARRHGLIGMHDDIVCSQTLALQVCAELAHRIADF